MEIKTDADRRLADHVLILFRGLKLSRDLELAESAIKAERELTDKLSKPSRNGRYRKELQPA